MPPRSRQTIRGARACHTGLVFIAAILFSTSHLPGAIILGVRATTDMGSGFNTNLDNTVNGTGLSKHSLTATHGASIPTNAWVSSGPLTGIITFFLGSNVFLDSFSFWNLNDGGPGRAGSTGIASVAVLTSLDGTVYTPLPGGPTTFAQVPGSSNLPPEIFTFPPVSASFVRFRVNGNHGDTSRTGFAEAAFNAAVPEPSVATLIGCALLGLLQSSRNRRNALRISVSSPSDRALP
ncbi:MAG: discoidin domain-containing protein [Verrucomicrobiales bacterium]